MGENNSTEGELQLLDLNEWTTLCAGSLEPIEAQIACRELGYSFYLQIGVIDKWVSAIATINILKTCLTYTLYSPAPDDNIFSVTLMNCNDLLEEMNMSPASLRLETCSYDLQFGECTKSVYLECGESKNNLWKF